MKTVCFFFVMMIAAVLLPRVSFAHEGNHAPQQAPARSSERSADQREDEVRSDADQAHSDQADDIEQHSAVVRRTTVRHGLSATHFKPVPNYRARLAKRPTTSGVRIEEPESTPALKRISSNTATNIPKPVSRRSPSVPSSAVSINGQQFKNSRVPGAHLVASGGQAITARGTGAINGTDMKRKP